MIDSVINEIIEMRESGDTVWGEWYGEACSLAEKLGSEPAMARIKHVFKWQSQLCQHATIQSVNF